MTRHTDGPTAADLEGDEQVTAPLIHVVPEAAAERGVERFNDVRAAVEAGQAEAGNHGDVRDFVTDAVEWHETVFVGGEPLGDWLLRRDDVDSFQIEGGD
jgi:type 1 glutamine amidotransferase